MQPPHPSPDPWIGRLLNDRYRLVKRIDEGGVAAVYRAEQSALRREVAVKILARPLGSHEEMRQRFEREARALGALTHPHVVQLVDFGVIEERPFLVMELLRGRSLLTALAEEPFDAKRSLGLVRQLLHALAHAHGLGIIHRDLKPANIFLERLPHTDDHVKVLDFGFAKFFGANDERDGPALTREGTTFGTPAYVAPEQLRKRSEVDGRADLYAVGVLLFQMLGGRRPFDGTAREILQAKMTTAAPALGHVRPDLRVAPELEAVLARALAADPASRFATAHEVLEALDSLPAVIVVQSAQQAKGRGPVVEPTVQVTAGMLLVEESSPPPPPAPPRALPQPPPTDAGRPWVVEPLPVKKKSLVSWSPVRRELTVVGRHFPAWVLAAVAATVLVGSCLGIGALWASASEDAAPSSPHRAAEASPDAVRVAQATQPAGLAQRPVPDSLAEVHAAVSRGEDVDESGIRTLRQYAADHREDPRPWLLLGHVYVQREWYADALEAYEQALRIDPDARLDPRMIEGFVTLLAQRRQAEKSLAVARRFYGNDLLASIDARLRSGAMPNAEAARLRQAREHLAR
jgi:serine/threonine-protein kinase